jgi:hypothetical protein
MEKREEMEARPPVLIDHVVHALIPPAARECVIGDLWERYRSPQQYAWEALKVMPYVVASQIRRTCNLPMLALQALTFFICFGGLAVNLRPLDIPYWLRASVPTMAAVIALLLRDAYRQSGQHPARRAALDVATAVSFVLASQAQAVLFVLSANGVLSPDFVLTLRPQRLLLLIASLAMIFYLRMWADQRLPVTDRDISSDDLSREYEQFRRSVHWRRLREITGALGGLVVGIGLFIQATDVAPQIGGALSIALAVFIAVYLAIRTSVEPMPQQTNFASSLALYRRELERQTNLLRRVAWLWSLTIIPPLVAEAIGRGLSNAQPFIHPLHVGGYLAICALIGWLYVQHARTLEARRAALAGIAQHG